MTTREALTHCAWAAVLIIGLTIGNHTDEDATYYKAMADSLATTAEKHSDVAERCLDTQEPVVEQVVETRRFVVALLGRVVRIEPETLVEVDR